MKKILTSILAIVALSVGAVHAAPPPQYGATAFTTGTTAIAASTTLSPSAATLTVTGNRNVAVQMSFNLSGTGTGNVVAKFAKSVDGTTYETVESGTLTVAASGTSTVGGVLLIDMGGAGYLKLTSVQNANTPSTVANLSVKAALKPGN